MDKTRRFVGEYFLIAEIASEDESHTFIGIDLARLQICPVNINGELVEVPDNLFCAQLTVLGDTLPYHLSSSEAGTRRAESQIYNGRFRMTGKYGDFNFANPDNDTNEAIRECLFAFEEDLFFRHGDKGFHEVPVYETWNDDEDDDPVINCKVEIVVADPAAYVEAILDIEPSELE